MYNIYKVLCTNLSLDKQNRKIDLSGRVSVGPNSKEPSRAFDGLLDIILALSLPSNYKGALSNLCGTAGHYASTLSLSWISKGALSSLCRAA